MAQTPTKSTHANPLSDRLEMRIPARAEWVRVVRLATAGVASRAGFAYDDIEDIKLAVAEACNNAILHSDGTADSDGADAGSTPSTNTAIVTIRWQLLENAIRISVSDEGRLDPPGLPRRAGSTPSLERSIKELPEGGMGLLLIESLMDEVEHETGAHADTTLHMTKRVPPALAVPEQSAPEKSATPKTPRSTKPKPDPDEPVALGAPRTSR